MKAFQPSLIITCDNGPIFNKFDVNSFTEISEVLTIEEIWIEMGFESEGEIRRSSNKIIWTPIIVEPLRQNPNIPIEEETLVIIQSHEFYNNSKGFLSKY